MSGFEPKIIAFLCNWCSYVAADAAGVSRLAQQPNVRVIRVFCSGMVDPGYVVKAFASGADGVLVAGCHPKDCHYTRGNFFTRRRFALVQDIFRTMELEEERLRLAWVSASEGLRYAALVRDFTQTLKEKGPNPTRDEIFL